MLAALQIPEGSNLNAIAALAFAVTAWVMLAGTRSQAAIALLVAAIVIPLGQQLIVFGLHFRIYRLLVLVGLIRLFLRSETRNLQATRMDRLFVVGALVGVACATVRGLRAETLGLAYDALGTYFLFRVWITELADITLHLRVLALLVLGLALCMANELLAQRNLFSVFGGVPEITLQREGRLRAQGPFRHPILAGSFGATLLGLMLALRQVSPEYRKRANLAALGCAFCTLAAASSGPLLTACATLAGTAAWRLRHHMKALRIAAVSGLIVLAAFMEAPVWYLISRVSEFAGGTGWHRSYLIDQAIRRLDEWWLVGSSYTAHWAVDPGTILPMDPDNMDITNHYIAQGLQGGALGLLLFVGLLATAFGVTGRWACRAPWSFPHRKLGWFLGVALFAHCVTFISVSYFDQTLVYWFWLLAVIAGQSHRSLVLFSTADRATTSAEQPTRRLARTPQAYGPTTVVRSSALRWPERG